ncbi:alpha/beta hydrolase [Gryllotalpicola koreensis]|uniref:Alpha/beta hydrolase n=1 Tax=Gryllotalpicola koreensis TaxID=993086 RepID=A0ABP8A0P6_9MICO
MSGGRRGLRGLRALAVVLTAAVLLVGCTATGEQKLPTQTSTPVASPSVSEGLSPADAAAVKKYYSQALVWSDCSGGFQCATAKAPLDWSHPAEGDPISLALIRKPATGQKQGSLFVNPGGPGVSGVSFVRNSVGATSATLQKNFDVIGWDPRGVGASSAVKCYDDKGLDSWLYDIVPGERGSPEWLDASKQSVSDLGQACLTNTGQLLGHIDTPSTARDLDMLRANVGDTKLNYLGFSYGTMIGAIYADLFPKNVGRMTLDGVLNPASSYDELTELQAKGFESNLRAYAQWCLTQDKTCPFSGSVDSAMNSIAALLNKVQQNPIANADGRMLGASTLLLAIITPLYSTANWPELDVLFKDVAKGSARVAFILADQYNDRDQNGKYTTNTSVAFQAIDCLDYQFDTDLAHMQAEAKQVAQVAPVMGPFFSYGGIACWNWPFKPTRTPAPVHATGSAPILVLGTTNDPATPYRSSVDLANDLENGHLVTWNGSGHTAYGRSNACVSNTVDDYFVKGAVPAKDPHC